MIRFKESLKPQNEIEEKKLDEMRKKEIQRCKEDKITPPFLGRIPNNIAMLYSRHKDKCQHCNKRLTCEEIIKHSNKEA